jgi:hypothetical protein
MEEKNRGIKEELRRIKEDREGLSGDTRKTYTPH